MDDATRQPDASRLIDNLVFSTSKRARRRAQQLLEQVPDRQAVPALIAALRAANSKRTFQTIAFLLSDRATEEGVDELARQARENKRFPRMPLRALGQCGHPSAIDRLVEFIDAGTSKQQRTAISSLGELDSVMAIEPLCHIAASDRASLNSEALRILQGMGRPARLTMRSLQDQTLSAAKCARIILALEIMPVYIFPLSIAPFDGERLLARLARRSGVWQSRAAQVLQRVVECRTLLRAANGQQPDVLLRPSSTAAPVRQDELLRASGVDMSAVGDDRQPEGRGSSSFADIMKKLFLRQD